MGSSILQQAEIDVMVRVVPHDVRIRLLAEARRRHGYHITPIFGETTLENCYRCECRRWMFWFNTPDHSTHMVWEFITTEEDTCQKL